MSKAENNKIQLSELIYLAYFAVMFGARAIGLYEGMLIYNITLVVGMLLFLLKIAMTRHTLAEYLIIGTLLLISLFVYYNTGEKGLLLYFTMMLGMKGVSLKRVMKLAGWILSVSFTVLVFLSVTGIRQDIIYIHDRTGFGRVIRHSLGYPYPNTLFTTYIVLMVLVFYNLGKQTRKELFMTTILFFIGSAYIYLYSCSNTGLLVAIIYLILNLYLQLRTKLSWCEKGIAIMAYPACLVFSIIGPLVTKGRLFELLDKILHNRWAYSYYYLTTEPITLFGIRFGKTPNDNYMIDSSFLYSFLQIGVIPFLIVTALMLGMIINYVKKEAKTELAIVLSFCVLGLSDPFFFNLSFKNILFLFIGELFFEKTVEISWLNQGILAKKILIFRYGEKMISCQTPVFTKIHNNLVGIKKIISQRAVKLFWLYMCILFVSIITILMITYSSNVMGVIDNVEEWEYFRHVLSIGVFGGAFCVGTNVMRYWMKGREKNENIT